MDGWELWIDLNARMPDFAREWGCKTLLAREVAVTGSRSIRPPHGCQPDFGTRPSITAYDAMVQANVAQYSAGLSADKALALRSCFDARMALAVTAEDIATLNKRGVGDVAKKVILAVNAAVQACKAEVAP